MATLLPTIKWSQRKGETFIMIDLQDVKNEKIQLTGKTLNFEGDSQNKHYSCSINFFSEILPEESKYEILGYQVRFICIKKDKEGSYWPRLTEENHKYNHIIVDWSKYIDSDDEGEEANKGMDGWDPSQMQGMPPGMMGGMGGEGDEEHDSDDEEGGLEDLKADDEDKKEDEQKE